jgi:hypothetical protein
VPYLPFTVGDLLAFFTAVGMGASLVNPFVDLFELSAMFSLSPQDYLLVQRMQKRTIVFFTTVVVATSFLMLAYMLIVWSVPFAFSLSIFACLCLAVAEVIYWSVRRRTVALTSGWTVVPDRFELIRKRLEYAQAISAVFALLAFMTIMLSITAAEVDKVV